MPEFVCIGKIIKTHGYEGAVLLSVDLESPEELEDMEFVHVGINGKQVPFFIKDASYAGKSNLIVSFLDYDSKEKITEFIGCSIFVSKDMNPSMQDSLDSLIGYLAFDKSSGKLVCIGIIEDVLENPAHLIFQINSTGKQVLIPAVDDFILSINTKKKEIVFNLPDGLLEI